MRKPAGLRIHPRYDVPAVEAPNVGDVIVEDAFEYRAHLVIPQDRDGTLVTVILWPVGWGCGIDEDPDYMEATEEIDERVTNGAAYNVERERAKAGCA